MRKSTFKPKQGQVDFSNARWAPVINCVLRHENKILVVYRSKELRHYPECWSGISGFLDDQKTLDQKVIEEIKEETGISKNQIKNITLGGIFDQDDAKYKKTWVVHPVLVEVMTDEIELDWEAREYKWVTLEEVKELKLLPGFDDVLKHLSLWR